jgi:hypothetical protein
MLGVLLSSLRLSLCTEWGPFPHPLNFFSSVVAIVVTLETAGTTLITQVLADSLTLPCVSQNHWLLHHLRCLMNIHITADGGCGLHDAVAAPLWSLHRVECTTCASEHTVSS